jgi:hypothetical protein
VVRVDKQLRLRAKGLGDPPIDLAAGELPSTRVYVAYTISNTGEVVRHCAWFAPVDCRLEDIAAGTGRRLRCRNGTPDPSCLATP